MVSETSSYMGVGKGVVFIESFVCRLFCITRHIMAVVITAVAADESNPVTNTNSTTVYGHKKKVQFNKVVIHYNLHMYVSDSFYRP